MRPYLWIALAIFLTIEIYSILPPRADTTPTPVASLPPARRGVIHVHSVFSHDGGGSIQKIAEAAKLAGHDFVIVTDHDNARARREGLEGQIDGVDIFVEMEASLPAGHALFFFSHTEARDLTDEAVHDLAWSHFLGQGNVPGVFLATAHPSNVKNPWNRLDRSPDGLEAINFDSVWQRQASESIPDFALTVLLSPFNPYLAALRFFQVYPKDFVAWDNMNAMATGHFAFLAHDTHEKLKLNQHWSLPWPSYQQTFRLASNVILLPEAVPEDFEARKKLMYQSLKKGRAVIVFQSIHPFTGNDWRLECGDAVYRSGDDLTFREGCTFVAQTPTTLPYPPTVRLVKDGEPIENLVNAPHETRWPLKVPGNYRLEVGVNPHTLARLFLNREVPYLFYNPIYVR